MNGDILTKAAVSVSEMAKMVGLSRARMYQLIKKGTFPPADHDPLSKRPCFLQEKQRQILEARRRNCGVDGKPVLFYSRRSDAGQKRTTTRPTIGKVKEVVKKYADLIDGLAALNVTASVAQVEPLVMKLFPNGTDGVDPGEVIRAVFLRIQSQNRGDKQR